VTLSRRFLKVDEQQTFEEELLSLSENIYVMTCDINNADTVQNIASQCKALLPPVKGVVHAGIVLRVSSLT